MWQDWFCDVGRCALPVTREIRRQREVFDAVVAGQGARRRLGAPVRDAFFSTEVLGHPIYPMAGLMSSRTNHGGGRGGKTRVLLYLSLLWVASGREHTSERPASFWAALIGLSDPDGAGSRAVRSNWMELARRGFVYSRRSNQPGGVPTLGLLREDGSGDSYSIPLGTGGDTYRRIPESAWKTLFWDDELTGAGLAMYLVALRAHGQAQGRPLVFSAGSFGESYGLGESTRKSGLKNLVDLGVLDVARRSADDLGSQGMRRRYRNVYTLVDHLSPPGDNG